MILLLSAMDTEIRDIGTTMEARRERSYGPYVMWEGRLDGKPVALARTGVGKVQSALCAQELISRLRPDYLIMTGLAGAINHNYQVGDTIIAKDCVQSDLDARGLGFERGMVPYTSVRFLPCHPALVALAATYQPREGRLHLGRICTADLFVDHSHKAYAGEIADELSGDAVEMEGAAVGYAAHLFGLPFLLARTISDKADGEANASFLSFLPQASRNSLALIRHVIAGL